MYDLHRKCCIKWIFDAGLRRAFILFSLQEQVYLTLHENGGIDMRAYMRLYETSSVKSEGKPVFGGLGFGFSAD